MFAWTVLFNVCIVGAFNLRNSVVTKSVLKQKMAAFDDSKITVKHSPEQLQHNFSWQQTMMRIKDPKLSIPFYEKNFGFRLIHQYDFPQWNFSLYFLAILNDDEIIPEPGTQASEEYLWTMRGTCLELTHNHGSEVDDNFKVSY